MFDSSILHSRALVAVVCLALAGACSGEDTGDEGTPTGAAGASGSGGSSAGAGATGFTNDSAGTGGGGGMGGSAAVSATAGRSGLGGSSGAPGAAGVASTAGAAGSNGGGGAAGAGGSDGEGGAAGAGGSDGEDDDAVVNYIADAQPILQANCSPCHSGLGLGGHNAASIYDDAVRVAENMLDEIESGDMPPACDGDDPGDPNCVSEEDLEVLEQWVDDDTPE